MKIILSNYPDSLKEFHRDKARNGIPQHTQVSSEEKPTPSEAPSLTKEFTAPLDITPKTDNANKDDDTVTLDVSSETGNTSSDKPSEDNANTGK